MLKKTQLTYRGINQDISNSKRDPGFYFGANNIRILATDSNTTGSITNDKGTELKFSIAQGYTIIGNTTIKDYLVLFTTNDTGVDPFIGVRNDIVYRIDLNDNLPKILFNGDLNFRISNYIEAETYYESDVVQKVYWVDGRNQLRHINIAVEIGSTPPYDANDAILFDAVPEVNFSAIKLESEDFGGIHTAGMIQYGYNLLAKGGSQTALSPLSQLYPLSKQNQGGKLNEVVGKILNLKIDNIDTRYDILRLYSIKYTSYNELPQFNLIAEDSISGSTFNYSDDGRVISSLTQDELLFLGGIPLIPSALVSKYNRLILGNIKEMYFDIDSDIYDTRAYRFPIHSQLSKIKSKVGSSYLDIADNGTMVGSGPFYLYDPYTKIPKDHDSINDDYLVYNYKSNSALIGATGTNIDIQIIQSAIVNPRNVLKSDEIYRLGIEFYNKYGQSTSPKWICDIKAPQGNLNGLVNCLKVDLKNTSILSSNGVVGWRVLRVERTDQDKTILCQGVVNSMIFQDYQHMSNSDLTKGVTYADTSVLKMPSPFMRGNADLHELPIIYREGTADLYIYKTKHGGAICVDSNSKGEDPSGEIARTYDLGDYYRQASFQETRLMQLYSPEVIFGSISLQEGLKLKFVDKIENTIYNSAEWAKKINVTTLTTYLELQKSGRLSLYSEKSDQGGFNRYARICGTGSVDYQNRYQYYRKYEFNRYADDQVYDILDTPIVVGAGQTSLIYNNDSKYTFSNSLGTILTDKGFNSGDPAIICVNSIGNRNVTLVLRDPPPSFGQIPNFNDKKLEDILGVTQDNISGVFEITRTLANQYGGNTYEARSRNTYLRIGDYKLISETSNTINSAGDTFVGQFRFARIMANTTLVKSAQYYEMTEIVEFPVETSIDINNRSDASESWNSIFMPTFDEYHNYNRVYSQQPTFNATISTPFTFVERKTFENRLLATKVKITGQLVDSWTDVQINEELYVDGNYGGIVKLIKNNDLVACFQDNAVSALLIQPRVQTVGTDGTSIELGRGSVLYDYKYITTTSGGSNKQCIFRSPSSIYYLDATNRSLNKISTEGIQGLSDVHGLHAFMYNNVNDSWVGNNGVVGCFDQITNDAYFSRPYVSEQDPGFTITFNEQTDSFVSKYSFIPNRYISTFKGLYTDHRSDILNAPAIWQHNVGEYGDYYGVKNDSTITLLCAPEPDADCVLNNLEFKSEVYSDGVDMPGVTMSKIRVWNNYQDSNTQTLTVGSNTKRKYRDWNMFIPRVSGQPLQRIRNSWNFIQLDFNNNNNQKLVLHDVIVSYDAIIKH